MALLKVRDLNKQIAKNTQKKVNKMKTKEITTTDLSVFGNRERLKAMVLLDVWNHHGLPEGFDQDHVHLMFNHKSGFVFLINSRDQVAMLNNLKLELWHSCWNCGHEGFSEDCQLIEDECNKCRGI